MIVAYKTFCKSGMARSANTPKTPQRRLEPVAHRQMMNDIGRISKAGLATVPITLKYAQPDLGPLLRGEKRGIRLVWQIFDHLEFALQFLLHFARKSITKCGAFTTSITQAYPLNTSRSSALAYVPNASRALLIPVPKATRHVQDHQTRHRHPPHPIQQINSRFFSPARSQKKDKRLFRFLGRCRNPNSARTRTGQLSGGDCFCSEASPLSEFNS
jgi:hypothetical protein